MRVTKLALTNFRSYKNLELEFGPGPTTFIGDNGSGKTNILDAVHYLSLCKSYMNVLDRQNIRFGQPYFSILGHWSKNEQSVSIHCAVKQGAKKVFKRNKKEYEKISEHIGRFPLVFISPYDGDLIAEGSEMRRKWMDGILVQLDKNYLDDIVRYSKILEQRNALLKNMFEHRLFDRDSIDIWDVQLIEVGERIHKRRKIFLEEFIPVFQKFYKEIGSESELVGLEYRSQLNDASFASLIAGSEKKDAITQYTNCGIHKDDLIFTIKGYPVKKFGSQGQQKSFIIALRLAQYDWLKQHKELKPILLLDDIFDKLDNQRVGKLIELVTADYFGQVLVTDTDPRRMLELFKSLPIEKKLFQLENGEIEVIID